MQTSSPIGCRYFVSRLFCLILSLLIGCTSNGLVPEPTLTLSPTEQAEADKYLEHGNDAILYYLKETQNIDKNSVLNTVQYLASKGADVLAGVGDETTLLVAADKGNIEVVQYLVSQGADVNVGAVIRRALLRSDAEVIKFLVAHGADIDVLLGSDTTPFHVAIQSYNANIDIIQFLVSQGADINAKFGNVTPLDEAKHRLDDMKMDFSSRRKSIEAIIEYLISQGAKGEME